MTSEAMPDDEEPTPSTRNTPVIRSIHVSELFGRYTYDIKVRNSTAPPIILLYGDNGSGKTTVLNMLWHLLSSAQDRNHRSALGRTPFRMFSVLLSNGDTITVRKTDRHIGDFEIIVARGMSIFCRQAYPTDPNGTVKRRSERRHVRETVVVAFNDDDESIAQVAGEIIEPGQDEPDQYVDYLSTIKIDPYFLADDRKIYSDHLKREASDRPTYRLVDGALVPARETSNLVEELHQALRRTNNWLRQQVLSGTAQGSQGADAIYLDVLSQLAGPSHAVQDEPSLDQVKKRIAELDVRSGQFNEFGLVPHVRGEAFLQLLEGVREPRIISLIEDVLTPYLDGQRARLDSLQAVESLIRTFVETVNGFLVNKRLSYTLRGGLRIRTIDGADLGPQELSSGERQLLVLLCNSLLSRDESALFIIDEPEISLNAKWQRKLIPAILSCVQSSGVQFILATHSVEIITGHRQFLAQLRPRADAK